MEEENFRQLVQRYVEKKSTDKELEVFVHLMKQGKLNQYLEEVMNQDLDLNGVEIEIMPERKTKVFRFWWPAAAAVIAIAGLLFFFIQKKEVRTVLAQTREITIRNSTKVISKNILPDGSVIWLNPQAVLSYPSKFGKFRNVRMQGEIFFEVKKDHAHPFIISSGNVRTKVWGTSFRIRSIPGEQETRVAVLTGKVSVSTINLTRSAVARGQDKEVVLRPEEEAVYQKTDHQLLKKPILAASDVIVWRKANLSFENEALSEITAQLSQHYHIRIEAEGEKLKKYKLTADFKDKNLADILLLICKSVQAEYSTTKEGIILRTANQQINYL